VSGTINYILRRGRMKEKDKLFYCFGIAFIILVFSAVVGWKINNFALSMGASILSAIALVGVISLMVDKGEDEDKQS
jgi:uncharacterized membrane protein